SMESILAAVNSSIVPLQEYLLQGSILDSSRDMLLHRLKGLCDNVEAGTVSFQDHEMVYIMRSNTTNQQPMIFRARRSLTHREAPWHLRYLGTTEPVADKSRHTLMRSSIDVGTSDNLVQFLRDIGFRLDHEFVLKGYFFRKGRMKVTVSKVFRIVQPDNPDRVEPLTGSYLVELSVVTSAGQEQVQEEMKNFAEQLKPLVILEKVDHRRLQQNM
ncbi:unnamed protein product, partial [Owenia fusiformis]